MDDCHACHEVHHERRSLGAYWYCHPCANRITRGIADDLRERMAIGGGVGGVGVRTGPFRNDHGPHAADIGCDQCEASWVGVPGDPCDYCIERHQSIVRKQRDKTLHPPDDTADTNAMTAWLARLKTAVTAGIINENDARFAYDKAKATNDRAA